MASDIHNANRTNRRDFLRLVGGTLGGALFSQTTAFGGPGRGGGQPGNSPLPSGYTFYRVLTLGDTANNPFPFAPLSDITPGVMLTEASQILFHGANATGARGVYALDMFYPPGGAPQIQIGAKLVEQGDVLSDGRLVNRIGTGDTNAFGSYATVIGTANPGNQFIDPATSIPQQPNGTTPSQPQASAPTSTTSGVYFMPPRGELRSLVQHTDPTPTLTDGSVGAFGAIFGDVALLDDNSTVVVAFYTQGLQNLQGLFHLTNSVASNVGTTVLSTGQMLPQSGAILTALGLVDVSPDNYYVIQAFAAHRGRGGGWGRGVRRDGLHPSALVNGHVQQPASRARLLAASRELSTGRNLVSGETYMGPRVGLGNTVAHVTHLSDEAMQLTHHRNGAAHALYRAGDTLEDDEPILSVGGPVVGPTGIVYYTQYLSDGSTQLLMSNGTTAKTILSSGDPLSPSGDVTEILLGYHPRQADSAGRILFTAEFLKTPGADPMDPRNIGTSLVVGIPF